MSLVNHQKVLNPTEAENLDRVGGRGLLLIHSFMDEVRYNARGNEITLRKYTTAGQKMLAKLGQSTVEFLVPEIEVPGEVIQFDDEPSDILEVV